MSKPLISLEDVTLRTVEGDVLEHLHWVLHRDERWAILGPAGSGKSLLAAALAGKVSPRAGTLRYHGDGPTASLRDLAVHVAFDKRPGGRELFHQARWHAALESTSPKVSDLLVGNVCDQSREEILIPMALDDLLERPIHVLSDGEWRRVQIAEALLSAPQLLILDDPFTGLDAGFRERLRDLVSALMENETYVLIIASDPDEIPESVTHVLHLADGQIRAQGPRAAVLAAYGDPDGAARAPSVEPQASMPCPSDHDAPPPIVEMHDVTIVHGGVKVLQNVHWTVRRGERWGVVGPNGAGKSTLLSLILGDHPQAYANEIALFGRPRGSGESIWEIKRRIGWVAPELHRYHPPLSTARDVVCSGFYDTLGLHQACSDEQKATAARWMALLDIEETWERPFRSLSKGAQRLVLIARALVKEPELLVLDEPCQGLDTEQRSRVLETLDGMLTSAQAMTSMIYVTHRPREFPRHLTHRLELRRGRVVRQIALDRTVDQMKSGCLANGSRPSLSMP